jgi:predicted DNA-binding protein
MKGKKERAVEKRIGSNIDLELYRKLNEIARMFGRTRSDLLKEGIWHVINQEKSGGLQKNKRGGDGYV